ncbi:hypothetical protein HNQ93_002202 [Hymenobacter luteus]|uniref:STAS/SEC14 domain-containing protein n=2 Tax=Hymenobacter TaxID=89966 RepID=A0A7W9T0I1_9BACT|nr:MULTISPECIES: hypothetical protein [Hymenobacter]MBB4602229.1 hypothetical protein [Hymenobacter latericoloratus]MBB6059342.1 hypothetical protein [Hymenobacter luteus]
MHQRLLSAPGSPNFCRIVYDEAHHWLNATWTGYVSPDYAHDGAAVGLQLLRQLNCSCLLNDNSGIQGPWFDSLEWLATKWGPAAAAAGLRYIAHVPQPTATVNSWFYPSGQRLLAQFEIQVFDNQYEAVEWLSSCQRQAS